LEFHRALVTLSGNSRLVLMWEQLVGQIRLALILVDPSLYEHEYLEATHRPLVDAMRAGDSVEATRLSTRS